MTQDVRRDLLGRLIDYAGLFPPAQLEMDDAVAGYRDARSGPHSWMLHRFVCPAARLGELAAHVGGGDDAWPVTATAELSDLDALAARNGPLLLDAVEVRLPDGAAAADVRALSEHGLPRCFVEVPLDGGTEELLDALAHAGLAAKVRCGGAAPAPSPALLAAFVAGCAARDLTWKATAGLHHPIRDVDEATGEKRHGFLNLLAASGLAAAGARETEIAEVLGDDDPAAFELDESGLRWRGHTIAGEARTRFDGYGSCSFDEPVEDLVALGALEAEAALDG